MLYLTRSPQEAIRIGDNITVMVIKVEGDRVTLGIQAPREVAVVRGSEAESEGRTPQRTVYLGAIDAN